MKGIMASKLLMALASVVAAGAPEIFPEDEIPNWATESTMQLSLTSAGGDVLPLDYPIMPSTKSLGLNQSDVVLGVSSQHSFVSIIGFLCTLLTWFRRRPSRLKAS